VSTRKDLFFYLAMSLPLYIALLVIVWRLGPTNLNLFGQTTQILLAALIISLAVVQLGQAWRVNREHLKEGVPEHDRYSFKQVAILDLAYMVTFGSELAVVSMLPLFFTDTFTLSAVTGGLLASGYAFMNLVARPGGGWVSDKFGRKKSLAILLCGLMVGYGLMSQIGSSWPIALAVIATMCCSFFVQAGEGAVFATVPLIKRRLTGQIAGMVGAYGNAGAVIFLTVLTFVDPSTFFLVIAASAAVALAAVQFLDEPKGHIAEIDEKGDVQLIEVG
jgi:NNP family nitrate/nitrite transporter-like MFS transporter